VTRPDGATIDLQYDTAGRPAAIVRPAGVTSFGYDPATGNLSTILAPGGEGLAFGYDGSLLTSTTWSGTVAGTLSRAYGDDFRLVSRSVNGAHSVTFAYDGDGFVTQAGALTLGRDPLHGLITDITLGAVTTSRGYSGFGELSSDAASFGATALYANGYVRDKLGRITQKTETVQGTTTTFDYVYDLAGRLEEVWANGAVTAAYVYDANGNRLSATTPAGIVAGTYDDQDRLTSYGDLSYAYTANGELPPSRGLAC
jgi:YD repeat-containing protein